MPTGEQQVKPEICNGVLYVLSTEWGELLQSVSISGGVLIFNYTRIFSQALVMEKSKASCYCQIKSFFKAIKLAG